MTDEMDSIKTELKRIETGVKRIETLWSRVEGLEHVQSLDATSNASSEVQDIALKIKAVRELIDKIDIKIDDLESRISSIGSLRFRTRDEA
ncbi:MAG: hypothetical protein ACTSV3_03270 [Candidatus Thorarchaeota archaeon]